MKIFSLALAMKQNSIIELTYQKEILEEQNSDIMISITSSNTIEDL